MHAIASIQAPAARSPVPAKTEPPSWMPQNNALRTQRPQRQPGILQALALLNRRGLVADQRRRRTQRLRRQLKRSPRPRARLVKQQRNRPPGEQLRALAPRAIVPAELGRPPESAATSATDRSLTVSNDPAAYSELSPRDASWISSAPTVSPPARPAAPAPARPPRSASLR